MIRSLVLILCALAWPALAQDGPRWINFSDGILIVSRLALTGGQNVSNDQVGIGTTDIGALADTHLSRPEFLIIDGKYGEITISLNKSPMIVDTHGQLLSDAAHAFWDAVTLLAPDYSMSNCHDLPPVSASPALRDNEADVVMKGRAMRCEVGR